MAKTLRKCIRGKHRCQRGICGTKKMRTFTRKCRKGSRRCYNGRCYRKSL